MRYTHIEAVYVVQTRAIECWVDDKDHEPYDLYWEAVGAAMKDAREYGVDMRVVRRTPEVSVFEIGGKAQ